jgi:hypothetical protein
LGGALGEGSYFHQSHGFYIDGVDRTTAVLAKGWERRLKQVTFDAYGVNKIANVLAPEDIAVSKICAGRPKDKDYVSALFASHLVDPDNVRVLLRSLPEEQQKTAEPFFSSCLVLLQPQFLRLNI